VLYPLGNLTTIFFAAGSGAMLAKIDVFTVDGHDGLSSALMESIAGSAFGRTEIRHGVTLSEFPKTVDYRFSGTLGRTAERRQVT
jgi:hypothetical protein